jgi:hypothetical protein
MQYAVCGIWYACKTQYGVVWSMKYEVDIVRDGHSLYVCPHTPHRKYPSAFNTRVRRVWYAFKTQKRLHPRAAVVGCAAVPKTPCGLCVCVGRGGGMCVCVYGLLWGHAWHRHRHRCHVWHTYVVRSTYIRSTPYGIPIPYTSATNYYYYPCY